MITLSQPSNKERTHIAEAKRPVETVETAGSLAMLFENGLMTMGQYDEFISSNPFAIDYSQYASFEVNEAANGGFLEGFSSALSTLGNMGASFSVGFSGGDCGGSCGGFSSFC